MMSTVQKNVIIVRIMKPATLTLENVMIMGVRFQGLNRLCVVVSKLFKQNTIIHSSVLIV